MSSTVSRFMVLAFARLSNYLILLLSPILFVRILDVHSYGQYQEFVVYALVMAHVLGFSIKGSLLYFIPRDPNNERQYLTQTSLFTLCFSCIGLALAYWAKALIIAHTSFDFFGPLLLYVFFFLNLDFIETYWLAKKRSDYVLYYTTSKTGIKLAVTLTTAYLTRDVNSIISTMTAIEGVKFLVLLAWFLHRRLFEWQLNLALLRYQLRYVLPYGCSALLSNLNADLGKLYTAVLLGPVALAIYTIGAYQVPVIGIVRSALNDVLFPEMVERNKTDPISGLRPWQKANVLYCFIVFPVFIVMFFYADIFIRVLFTDQYIAAVPIFQTLLLLMIRQCFEMSSAIRAMNAMKFDLTGGLLATLTNVVLILALVEELGAQAPAVALVAADLVLAVYLCRCVLKIYSIRLSEVLMWGKIGAIVASSALALPILLLEVTIPMNDIARALICSSLYGGFYYLFIRYFKIEEIELVIDRISQRFRLA
jgi:O-antigen/teichoic acid export membrane protein